MDVSEYNPAVEEWRTGRLVANMFYFFAMGVASRQKTI
jgi:formiminoglutamase